MKKKAIFESQVFAHQQALLFRQFCHQLIRERIRSKDDKQRLADALGLSLSAADALAYKGVGSFETFLGALFFLYEIDLKVLQDFFLNDRDTRRRQSPTRHSDQVWFELDEVMTEDEKAYWASLIRAAKKMELSLRRARSPSSSVLLRAAEKKIE